jgi:hypothetical protein
VTANPGTGASIASNRRRIRSIDPWINMSNNDFRKSSSERLVKKLAPVDVMVANKRSPNSEPKPMAKTKAPAPKATKDSRPIKGANGAESLPKKAAAATKKAKAKG